MDQDRTAPVSILIWGPHWFYTYANQKADIYVYIFFTGVCFVSVLRCNGVRVTFE